MDVEYRQIQGEIEMDTRINNKIIESINRKMEMKKNEDEEE